jgi:hypothetical protein
MTWLDDKPVVAPPQQVGALFQFQLFLEVNAPLSGLDVAKAKERFIAGFQSLHPHMCP